MHRRCCGTWRFVICKNLVSRARYDNSFSVGQFLNSILDKSLSIFITLSAITMPSAVVNNDPVSPVIRTCAFRKRIPSGGMAENRKATRIRGNRTSNEGYTTATELCASCRHKSRKYEVTLMVPAIFILRPCEPRAHQHHGEAEKSNSLHAKCWKY